MAEGRRATAILISGRGSNMSALIAAAKDPRYPARIALVASDKPEAPGLAAARDAGIPTAAINGGAFPTKAAFERNLDATLRDAGIELVCLAGFMLLLSDWFVTAWRDRILNVHPSLLPLFGGLNTHARALAAGVRIHGATVHVVRTDVDAGPIVAQAAVPVLPLDTEEALAARVLAVEHRIYPLALKLIAGGRARIVGEHVEIDGERVAPGAALLSPPD